MRTSLSFRKMKQAGQGMTEYIIIVALIAVSAIAVTQLFGTTVRSQMGAIAKEVGGDNATSTINEAKAAGGEAATAAAKKRSLSTYGDQATTGAAGTN
jgi:type IV pilus assembly protein PilA